MIRSSQKNNFDWKHFVKLTKRKFKKKFGSTITSTDIKRICEAWIQHRIIDGVVAGDCVQIDRYQTVQLIGTPVLEDKKFFKMLLQGKSVRRNGTIKTAELNPKRKDFKYKIVYKHSSAKSEIYFDAHPNFARQVHEALINTNNYYKIEYVNQ